MKSPHFLKRNPHLQLRFKLRFRIDGKLPRALKLVECLRKILVSLVPFPEFQVGPGGHALVMIRGCLLEPRPRLRRVPPSIRAVAKVDKGFSSSRGTWKIDDEGDKRALGFGEVFVDDEERLRCFKGARIV